MHWSISANMCLEPSAAECEFGEAFECPSAGIHQLPHPDSCEDFYLCVNGNGVERSCPGGLHFSPNLGSCAPPGEIDAIPVESQLKFKIDFVII
jgi:hypothetical protein